MINLIPPQGHKVIKREYLLRVTATLSMLFGAVGIILAIGCVPVYVLVNAQINALTIATEKERVEDVSLGDAEEEIRTTKEILGQLHSVTGDTRASELLHEVEELAPTGISFRNFTMGYEKSTVHTIAVEGTATTRETLIRFKKDLETSSTFQSAEVPIAELAKDTNLPFSMSITLAEPH